MKPKVPPEGLEAVSRIALAIRGQPRRVLVTFDATPIMPSICPEVFGHAGLN